MMPKLAYTTAGEGDESLLLCHGYLGSNKIWEALLPCLSTRIRLLLPDLPGHGESPIYSDTHSMDFMAEKLLEILDAEGIEKLHFIGHSMGGYVGLALLETHPERLSSLTLLNSTCAADDAERKENRLRAADLATRSREAYVRATIRGLFPGGFEKGDGPIIQQAIDIGLGTPLKGITAALRGMRLRPDRCHLIDGPVPVSLVAGKSDPVLSWDQLRPVLERFPTDRQRVFAGGHMSMFEEEPEVLCRALTALMP